MKRVYQVLSALKVPNKDEKEKSWEVMDLITEIYIENVRARLRGKIYDIGLQGIISQGKISPKTCVCIGSTKYYTYIPFSPFLSHPS